MSKKSNNYLVKKNYFSPIFFVYQGKKLTLKYKKLQLNLLQDIQVMSIFLFRSLSPKLEDTPLPLIIQLLTMMQTLTLLIISYLVPSVSVSTFKDINSFGGY
jgi:hypothetical protein